MDAMAPGARRNVLLFSAVAEVGTGLFLFLAPEVLVRWLFGGELSGDGLIFARCFGVAIASLGLAPAFRTLLIYNALIALYLAFVGVSRPTVGPLLWPVVAAHAAVALLLVWTGRTKKAPVS
jgi:hypothetical protein